jgi:hypothetical protein
MGVTVSRASSPQDSEADLSVLRAWEPDAAEKAYFAVVPAQATGRTTVAQLNRALSLHGSNLSSPVLQGLVKSEQPSVQQLLKFLEENSGLRASVVATAWQAAVLGSDDWRSESVVSERSMHTLLRLIGIAAEGLTPSAANLASSAFSSRPGSPSLGVRFADAGKWKLEVPSAPASAQDCRVAAGGGATSEADQQALGSSMGGSAPVVVTEGATSLILARTSSIAWSTGHFRGASPPPTGMPFATAVAAIAARLEGDRWLSHSKALHFATEACSLTGSTDAAPASLGALQFATAYSTAELLSCGFNPHEFFSPTPLPRWLAVLPEHVRVATGKEIALEPSAAVKSDAAAAAAAAVAAKQLQLDWPRTPAQQQQQQQQPSSVLWSWSPSASLVETYSSIYDALRSTSKAPGSILSQSDFARYAIYELRLPFAVARYAWSISDVTCNGTLDCFKFRIAHHVVREQSLRGWGC